MNCMDSVWINEWYGQCMNCMDSVWINEWYGQCMDGMDRVWIVYELYGQQYGLLNGMDSV